MKSTVTSDGQLKVTTNTDELALLRAYTREVSGKARPTMADVRRLLLNTYNSFYPKGGRYPEQVRAKRVTVTIS